MTPAQYANAERLLADYDDGVSIVRLFQRRAFCVRTEQVYDCRLCDRGSGICSRCVVTFAPLTGIVPQDLTRLIRARLLELGDKTRAEILRRFATERLPESRLRQTREKLKLTQRQLARKLGVSTSTIERAERNGWGLGKLPTKRLQKLLAQSVVVGRGVQGVTDSPPQVPCFKGSGETKTASLRLSQGGR